MFGLWVLFTGEPENSELWVGLAAAAVAATASEFAHALNLARIMPHGRLVLPIIRLPGSVVRDTAIVLWAVLARAGGKRLGSRLVMLEFEGGDESEQSSARRAMATTLATITPNTVVIGIERDKNKLLYHELVPSSVPAVLTEMKESE